MEDSLFRRIKTVKEIPLASRDHLKRGIPTRLEISFPPLPLLLNGSTRLK
jgi:hypothetical protein